MEAALKIVGDAEAKLRRKELANQYLLPYIERIAKQQRGRADDTTAQS